MKPLLRLISLAGMSLASAAAAATAIAVRVIDSSGKPLADVVVAAEPDGGAAVPKTLEAAEIEQRGLRFLPLVSVIQTGSRVSFPNYDKVKHHIYSFSPAKKFDQKLYSGVAATPQVFDKAGIVVLGCNIHDRMLAYIQVVDTPFFAKTDAAGVARIDVPAAGKYTLSSWHFNMAGAAVEQAVAVKADEGATTASVRLTMKPPAPHADSPGASAP
ncbi:methylamine utilization protein [Massilia pseudoviolaceinigra]|uniref:methylamine utilization protein n=1 Tax=Massilia pseudoviolaceinigra TaxID=3057165 RepID=UPI0027965774|nr:methylamine utilization protein [Massilia sp. CCM 9206]MDQ1922050.1 methylamine utilization protein [Massilia sp. CCM 9206]